MKDKKNGKEGEKGRKRKEKKEVRGRESIRSELWSRRRKEAEGKEAWTGGGMREHGGEEKREWERVREKGRYKKVGKKRRRY